MNDYALSPAARSVWAKSLNHASAWLPLWQHMDDSADVARILFDTWLPRSTVALLADQFDGDVDDARAAITFLAGVHDLGKAVPAFSTQDSILAWRMSDLGLYTPSKQDLPDRDLAHHTVAGHHLLIGWLEARGWSPRHARAWAVVLGGHHGVPPDAMAEQRGVPELNPELYGRGKWQRVQNELATRQAHRCDVLDRLDAWRDLELSQQFQVLATGIVIVADWIASNVDLFPFHADELPEVHDQTIRATVALAKLRLPKPWHPAPPEQITDLFSTRFTLPAGATPRPVQNAAVEVARTMPEPGLLVVEAPMGEGKTEAALAAAEVMAARWGAGGLLVALPTQATSDAMFDRVVNWLDAIGESGHDVGGSIVLSHGKARFNRVFQGLVNQGNAYDVGRDEGVDTNHQVLAHAWLSGRKKGQLANFAVATIDQLLFAGLRARHLMLRHLSLAGKVVVLDEIHAYDAFMNSYLTKVLAWLGAYRVPVIALSATLPAERRRDLLAAYQSTHPSTGDDARGPAPNDAARNDAARNPPDDDLAYPVLTWTGRGATRAQAVPPSGRSITVHVDALDDDLDVLVRTLRDHLADGGTALVVRNTVRRVLDAAGRLQQEFPGEVTVTHSRFIVADRVRKDAQLLDAFGAPGRARERPRRHVVVASQVVEQSLDVDFDLLVTDLAPIDLVLQRIGRLHRHQRGHHQQQRPPRLQNARAYITGADFTTDPPTLERAAEKHVYGAHVLLRAAAVLAPHFGQIITLPDDIAPLVQAAYGRRQIGPASWQDAMADAYDAWRNSTERREDKARFFQIAPPGRAGKAIVGWLSGNAGETDDDAQGRGQVRDGAPTLEALVVQAAATGEWRTPSWLDPPHAGLPIPRDTAPPDPLAEVMMSCNLRLPLDFSDAAAEEALWAATPPPWEMSPIIYRLPVLVIDDDGYGEIDGRPVRYTPQSGLEVLERGE